MLSQCLLSIPTYIHLYIVKTKKNKILFKAADHMASIITSLMYENEFNNRFDKQLDNFTEFIFACKETFFRIGRYTLHNIYTLLFTSKTADSLFICFENKCRLKN